MISSVSQRADTFQGARDTAANKIKFVLGVELTFFDGLSELTFSFEVLV